MSASESTLQQQLHILYTDHHGWLQSWLRKKLGCAHRAADMAQDIFLRILTARDALLGVREPRAYLTTTAKRLMIDRARRQALEQAYLAELKWLSESSTEPAPEVLLATLQALEQLSAVLQGVPARAREAFLLHYLEGETHAAIAAQLGVSVRMVQKYLVQVLIRCQSVGDEG